MRNCHFRHASQRNLAIVNPRLRDLGRAVPSARSQTDEGVDSALFFPGPHRNHGMGRRSQRCGRQTPPELVFAVGIHSRCPLEIARQSGFRLDRFAVDRVRCEISRTRPTGLGAGQIGGELGSAFTSSATQTVTSDPDVHSDTDALWHVAIASPTRDPGEVISQCKVVISPTSNVSGA